jgi:hypothetical protein
MLNSDPKSLWWVRLPPPPPPFHPDLLHKSKSISQERKHMICQSCHDWKAFWSQRRNQSLAASLSHSLLLGWNLELRLLKYFTNQGNSDVDNDTMATVITITNQNLVQVLTIALEAKGHGYLLWSILISQENRYICVCVCVCFCNEPIQLIHRENNSETSKTSPT